MAYFTISGVKHSVGTKWYVTFLYIDRWTSFFPIYLPYIKSTLGTLTNFPLFFF